MIMRRVEFKAPDLREIRAGRLPEITKFSMFLGILKQSALYQHKPRGLIKAPESVPRYNRIPDLKICANWTLQKHKENARAGRASAGRKFELFAQAYKRAKTTARCPACCWQNIQSAQKAQ